MRFVRRWRAWIVLAASLAVAVWVYSYRVSNVVVVIDVHRNGHYQRARHLAAQPWWGTPAAVLVAAIGIGLFVRLLPARQRILRICTSRLTRAPG
jgi:hypothetical protein